MPKNKDRAESTAPDDAESINQLATRLSSAIGDPAQSIVALAAEVMGTPLGTLQREQLRHIQLAAQSLLGVVSDLADYAGLSAGNLTLFNIPFSLRDQVARLAGSRVNAAQDKGLLLHLEIDSDVPDTLVGDPERLTQILGHLLDNAIRHTQRGEVLLRVEPEFITHNEATLAFAVSDTGADIPEDVKACIAGTASPALDGPTGLGLTVAVGLIKAMDGILLAAMRPKGGCTLSFSVAFGTTPKTADKPVPERFSSLVALPMLLVSEDAEEREELARQFQGWHMRPIEADSGDMALAILERNADAGKPIPLMVFTNRIHHHDGFMLAMQVKHHAKASGTRLIMLTNEGKRGDAMKCREIGVAGYLPKPINPHDLYAAVNTIMGVMRVEDYVPTLVTRHSLREQRHGATILLVEDDRDSQLLTAHFLDRDKFSVVLAANAAEAQAMAELQAFDLILLDMELPGMDGFKVAQKIRAAEKASGRAAPIIALTSGTSIERQKRFQAAGITDYLQKPLKRDALLATVFRYVTTEG